MRLRGRKGIREELEQQQDLVVLDPRGYKGKWAQVFGNDRPLYIELGMGKGQFVSGMSFKHPACNFVGMDMYDELIRRASEKVRSIWSGTPEGEPSNVRLALGNIESIEEFFAPGEVSRIYLNFSDPWPKKKHARRRLTHPRFLDKYCSLLNQEGEIHFKTDSRELFEFSLNAFAAKGLQMSNISLNLHKDGINEQHVMTEYESKFSKQGMPIYRCEVKIGETALEDYHRTKMEEF
ncbi:tRNA (guanine-N(7)-)-methyltransferase [Paenibacillus antibioticophila]|uniref:tRNA (guanine-N(7)-)-methyltransferase n=1 Tax=Paenibacillus antibioticophila TaxID=1274374 RepID=A0A919XSN5_9BACL|nr:tRNA (guanosine(46)-N7)-methyltransferase TrmB [Paenibacillus antibioticophila]GIO38541.1 tRNA (guanine-N(7)-)-methyltransferase [Paenibacillus antibioticophila]